MRQEVTRALYEGSLSEPGDADPYAGRSLVLAKLWMRGYVRMLRVRVDSGLAADVSSDARLDSSIGEKMTADEPVTSEGAVGDTLPKVLILNMPRDSLRTVFLEMISAPAVPTLRSTTSTPWFRGTGTGFLYRDRDQE